MVKINRARVLLGGLVAGLVLIFGEFILEPFVGSMHERWLSEMGLPLPGEGILILLTAMSFVVGATIVWLYAAIRLSYGSGPGTAALVGLAAWILGCFVPNVVMFGFGALSSGLFWYFTIHQLVVVPAAAIAGAWMYRDAEVPVAARTTGATA